MTRTVSQRDEFGLQKDQQHRTTMTARVQINLVHRFDRPVDQPHTLPVEGTVIPYVISYQFCYPCTMPAEARRSGFGKCQCCAQYREGIALTRGIIFILSPETLPVSAHSQLLIYATQFLVSMVSPGSQLSNDTKN